MHTWALFDLLIMQECYGQSHGAVIKKTVVAAGCDQTHETHEAYKHDGPTWGRPKSKEANWAFDGESCKTRQTLDGDRKSVEVPAGPGGSCAGARVRISMSPCHHAIMTS